MFSASRSFVSSLSSSLRPRVLMSTRRLASSPPPPPLPETRFAPKKAIRAMSLSKFVAHQTAFALRLAQRVAAAEAKEGANVAFSPLSLHALLSLAAAGTRGPALDELLAVLTPAGGAGGATADDVAALAARVVGRVLADASAGGGPRVSFANGVWVDASLSLKAAFAEIAASAYKAEIQSVDFQTKAGEIIDQINSWVSSATNGLIKSMISGRAINQFTRVVLGNAIYFKGAWADRFDASGTEDGEFHLLNGNSVRVPFMTNPEMQFMSSYDDFKVLRLPYRKGNDRRQFSMYIFLPDDRDGLWSLIDKLSSDPEFLNRHLPKREVKLGEFRIPKFKISCGLDAPRLLEEMGVHLLFCGDGGLTEIADSPITGGTSILHKSFIEVNEEGTEAAAASFMMLGACFWAPPPDFVADHPFFFLIREDTTEAVLFMGHVLDPSVVA
ncbi:serpin-ZXA-like [Ananas comosus]|uniref:Serpin-ZXA-like n=1 Tax=Ananas comosus TaxID=4615 RepID=A0A6P5FYV2_ANACO|nr:serpin-ZXA-like [Ananas comosus]